MNAPYREQFIQEADRLMQLPEFMLLKQFTENSSWHREESVYVHTLMVIEAYVAYVDANISTWTWDCYLGGIACVYHDAGKPNTAKAVGESDRLSFHGHEAISAKVFVESPIARSMTPRDRVVVEWLIQHHLPFGTKASAKLAALGRGALASSPEVFNAVLWADQRGRISDDADSKYQKVGEWIDNQLAAGINAVQDVDLSTYSRLDSQSVLVPVAGNRTTSTRRKLFVLVGPSGSGKTTLTNQMLAENPDLTVFSWDTLRMQLSGCDTYEAAFQWFLDNTNIFYSAAYKLFEVDAASAVSDMVLDNTNLISIDDYIIHATNLRFDIVYVVFNVDRDQLMARQDSRGDKTVPVAAVDAQLDVARRWKPFKHNQVVFMSN